jgi:hypothetical protein
VNSPLIQVAITINMGVHKLLAHQYFNGKQQEGYSTNCQDDKK